MEGLSFESCLENFEVVVDRLEDQVGSGLFSWLDSLCIDIAEDVVVVEQQSLSKEPDSLA